MSVPTIKRWIREGHLKAFRTAGGHYRVTEDELRRFQTALQFPTSREPARAPSPRILVVEDDPKVLDMLVTALGLHGYKVEVAHDGYEGLVKVGTYRPDLMILDIRLPHLDGFRVCQAVKDDPVTQATKILAITAYPTDDARRRIREAGADAFLAKPFSIRQLETQAARLLGPLAGAP